MSVITNTKTGARLTDNTGMTIHDLFQYKHRLANGRMDWGPALRSKFGYYSPDDRYEHLLTGLITPETRWLDVGAGSGPCASERVSRLLAERCRRLVGVDPSNAILQNPYVHEYHQIPVESYYPPVEFDLITLRMVAEHVQDPETFVRNLIRLARPGGHIVIYTVYGRSPGGVIAQWSPFWCHHPIKKWLWSTEEEDTFPVFYRMNTPGRLRKLFGAEGGTEKCCWLVDDCRTLGRFRWGLRAELTIRAALRRFGAGYPERCLVGVYTACPRLAMTLCSSSKSSWVPINKP